MGKVNNCKLTRPLSHHTRLHSTRRQYKSTMSYSNADTGNKPADSYTQKNLDSASLEEKVNDLVTFAEKQKFCMMTTRIADSGLLVSRCMALAAKEGNGVDFLFTQTQSLARRMTSRATQTS